MTYEIKQHNCGWYLSINGLYIGKYSTYSAAMDIVREYERVTR